MVLISRLAAELAFLKGRISVQARQRLLRDLLLLPERVKEVVARQANLRRLAERYGHRHNCESALKLKEVTYLHAEGMPAGFLKHGTLSLIEESVPSVVSCSFPKRGKPFSAYHEQRRRSARAQGDDHRIHFWRRKGSI